LKDAKDAQGPRLIAAPESGMQSAPFAQEEPEWKVQAGMDRQFKLITFTSASNGKMCEMLTSSALKQWACTNTGNEMKSIHEKSDELQHGDIQVQSALQGRVFHC
jgi:hypothetical protein